MNLNLRENGHDRGSNAEQHIDADEDFVLSTTIRVSVVHVEEHQSHQGQHIVDRSH